MYDIIIVGAGPAGLTAALYAGRTKKKVLVLEAKVYGGQIINTNKIVNYPGFQEINGVDFATKLYDQVINMGVEIVFDKVINIDTKNMNVITNNKTYNTKAIILAMGVQNKKTGLINEDRYLGKGLSYCATCDGSFYKDKDVCVYGGESSTLEEALYLSDICNKVYIINKADKFNVSEELLERLKVVDNERIWVIAESLRRGISISKISEITKINEFFKKTDKHLRK